MDARIRAEIPDATVELAPGGKGDFIVTADGQLLWDKRNMGNEFPDEGAIVKALRDPGTPAG